MAGVFAFLAFRVGGALLRGDAQVADEGSGTAPSGAPAGGTPPAAAAETPPERGTRDGEGDSREELKALVEKLRPFEREAQKAQRDLKAAQTRLAELENAQLSDREKLERERDELKQERDALRETMRTREIRAAATSAATKAGAVDAEVVARLIDVSEVETTDDGKPRNLESLLNRLKSDHPVLFRPAQGSADGGARGAAGAVDPGTGVSRLRYAYEQSQTAARR